MSGIVGVFNLNGAPIDRTLLARLTNALSFRGPDAQRMWCRGQIGFGHTLLQSTLESKDERQPLSLDGNSWIVADARVDARHDLIAELQPDSQQPLDKAPDVELILRAYQVWGENCLDHLMGDFVFAIWDSRQRRLFCARDQMGIKPLFYAHLGALLIFSNTLDCIRQHPGVSDKLNELSIADFLLFDMIQDPAATAFTDIQRLPPAHSLLCEEGKASIRRYWAPSISAPPNYRHPADYIERFNELLDAAVSDRLRTDSACIFMSGGLDSPTVASSAKRASTRSGGGCSLWAYTQVFDSLIPHEERHYATLVAHALKIPIEYRADDHLRLFQFAECHSPEPVHVAWPDVTRDQLRRAATASRVVLTGFGADPLLSTRISVHFRGLLRQRCLARAFADAFRYLTTEGRLSRLYLRTRWRILFASKETHSGFFPPWFNEDLAQKQRLRERWETVVNQFDAPAEAVRPEAYEVTFSAFWPDLFGSHDAGVTTVPVEVRHPFFDIRLMSYLLALPRLPWCSDKHLLREAARGTLPDSVRLRRKSPLKADPLLKLLEQPDADWVNHFQPVPELAPFVVRSRIPHVIVNKGPWAHWVHLRPLSLNYWLRGLGSSGIRKERGFVDELAAGARS